MLQLTLLRHGQTACSVDGRMCGTSDQPLDTRGLKMAEAMAEPLATTAWDAIYSSPLLRAKQTADPLARALAKTIILDSALAEISYGDWELKQPTEIRQSHPQQYANWLANPATTAPPGGESGAEVATRAMAWIRRVREKHATGKVIAFSHKTTIRIVVCTLLGIELSLYRVRIDQPVASLNVIEFHEQGPRLLRLGDQSHLPSSLRDTAR